MFNKRCVISLSGGLDSSSLLVYLIAQGGYDFYHCYGFDYGQAHSVEIDKARQIADFLKDKGVPISYQLINVRDAFSDSQSSLNASNDIDVAKEGYNDQSIKNTVVENRNIIFSSIIYGKALAISKKYDCKVDITLGVHSNDDAVYPDCRKESVEMSKELYRISNWGSENVDYFAPFVGLTKTEVLGRGLEGLANLGIKYEEFYEMTSSCYDPTEYHGQSYSCGLCATCRDRLKAFEDYGLKDPIKYTKIAKDLGI